jgi:hypothetical protein
MITSAISQAQILILNKLTKGPYILVESKLAYGSAVIGAIDYGQPFKRKGNGAFSLIVDIEGEPFKFNSIIHLFNTLDKDGWAYVNSDGMYNSNTNVNLVHYLFKRKEEQP